MKKIIIISLLFIIYTIFISYCPLITTWDKNIIILIQNLLKDFPADLFLLPDCRLYSLMIILPLLVGTIFFAKKCEIKKILFLYSIPLFTFVINCIIKPLIHRTRPPFELQQIIHPHSYSYVSSHSLVTMVLYGTIIYYVLNLHINKTYKLIVITASVLWILFVGISRIWLGVHYPTDVIGAYILGFILILIYSKIPI